MVDIERANGVVKMTYKILTRNLIGLRRLLLTATKGNLVMNNHYLEGVKYEPSIELSQNGRIISSASGQALAYALNMIQERGQLFISPMTEVYEGMIIGINKYDEDIYVNPMKAREKSNVRVSSAVITDIALKTPLQLTLEFAIAFLAQDEILEVTPQSLRLRKKFLNKTAEYLAGRGAKK
jgi:GTP-binding protein